VKKDQQLLKDGAAELGLALDEAELLAFSRFAEELAKWNRKINLTAITAEEDVAVKHFLDSLTVAAHVPLAGKLLDIGSGAGFPGIPLQIIKPDLRIVSVDAVEKKILFQRHAARLLGLENFTALHVRGESLQTSYGAYFDIIISRAFTDLMSFVAMVLPLLADGGRIVAMKGSEGKSESELAEPGLAGAGLHVEALKEFSLPFSGDRRSIIIIRRNNEASIF
jgi:16S rRNA (guanine527-N7)-methyltransferase